MKIYESRRHVIDSEAHGHYTTKLSRSWHTSERAAQQFLQEHPSASEDTEVKRHLIPRGKKALLKWLNIHHRTDNG